MRIATMMRFGMLLSLIVAGDVAAREIMTIYQTQTLKVSELHRVNKDKIELIIIELDKVERLEAELTRQADIAPGAKESDGEKALRGQMTQLTLNAIGRAWREKIHALQQGINDKRLPSVVFRGKVYHQVHDIRSILKP